MPSPIDKYLFEVKADELAHSQTYSNEELWFLTGDGVPEIPAFREALGLWDNFSVSGGMNEQAWTLKNRETLLRKTSTLLCRLEAERSLFSFTYKLKCPGSLSRGSTRCWVGLNSGEQGFLFAKYPGQLYFKSSSTPPAYIDLRGAEKIEVAGGEVRVYRKQNTLRWEEHLRHLIHFLDQSYTHQVAIRHAHVRNAP